VVFVSMAIAIALDASSMSDIAVLAQLAPVLGAAPSGSTIRRALGLADARTLEKIAQARTRIRAHVWKQRQQTPSGSGSPPVRARGRAGQRLLECSRRRASARSMERGCTRAPNSSAIGPACGVPELGRRS
jgi:hypothetical protein